MVYDDVFHFYDMHTVKCTKYYARGERSYPNAHFAEFVGQKWENKKKELTYFVARKTIQDFVKIDIKNAYSENKPIC